MLLSCLAFGVCDDWKFWALYRAGVMDLGLKVNWNFPLIFSSLGFAINSRHIYESRRGCACLKIGVDCR